MNDTKRPKLVGSYIRSRREALGLSQRALGLLFSPTVTTQFISNVERGVTPLPPAHVPTLANALSISAPEIMNLLEKEYSQKLNDRLGRPENNGAGIDLPHLLSNRPPHLSSQALPNAPGLATTPGDLAFMQSLYDAYKQADQKTRQSFADVCESILNVTRRSG